MYSAKKYQDMNFFKRYSYYNHISGKSCPLSQKIKNIFYKDCFAKT